MKFKLSKFEPPYFKISSLLKICPTANITHIPTPTNRNIVFYLYIYHIVIFHSNIRL
ncbi:hypothetical protein [uncultured Campylobacter sp.]|uniref:hypothetical protein n=1 Tax=uncultured Campylobacter sp. TaxID=218934 RepID=UPI002622BEBF|nr:hypothetical protein [uncultured Campylobacter sp.]